MMGPGIATVTFAESGMAKWFLDNLNGNIPQGLSAPIAVRAGSGGPQNVPPPSGGYPAGGPMSGTVKHWVEDRGMGFIAPSDGGQDCFVHRSDIVDGLSLVPGSTVQFKQGWDNRKNKPTAMEVRGGVGGDGVGKGAAKVADFDGKGLH